MLLLQLVLVKEALQYREPARAGRRDSRAVLVPSTDSSSTFVGQTALQPINMSKGG